MEDTMIPAMMTALIICTVVSFIFMCLRFMSKRLASSSLGLDDAVLIFAWILFLVFVVLSLYTTKLGLGRHFVDVDLANFPQMMALLPISQFFAVISVSVSKSSFILTLLRLVAVRWHQVVLWFMLITINASMFTIGVVQFYQCAVPPVPGCVDGKVVIGLGVYAAGYSSVMDLVLTAFPTLVIWKLQMKKSDKIGIIASMSLGIVAGAVGLYKTTTIPYVARDADFTYGTAYPLIWLAAEVSATIVAASIPFFRPLVRLVTGTEQRSDAYGMSNTNPSNNPGKVNKSYNQPTPDDSSDSHILKNNNGQNIMRHTSVTVEHSAREDGRGNTENERGIAY